MRSSRPGDFFQEEFSNYTFNFHNSSRATQIIYFIWCELRYLVIFWEIVIFFPCCQMDMYNTSSSLLSFQWLQGLYFYSLVHYWYWQFMHEGVLFLFIYCLFLSVLLEMSQHCWSFQRTSHFNWKLKNSKWKLEKTDFPYFCFQYNSVPSPCFGFVLFL